MWIILEEIDRERVKLQQTIGKMNEQLEQKRKIPRYTGKDLVEQALDEKRLKQIRMLEKAIPSPYFGRIDFREEGRKSVVPYYIGKYGIEGENQEVLVVDWRAPLASMFYSFSGASSQAEYVAPEGLIEGEIFLKRHFQIREKELEQMVDSYVQGKGNMGGGDEYLLTLLEEKKDRKLRDIVSTIQQEQDHIIRLEKDQAVIIQGAPGSGKTTVALHRVAYLLYQYQEQLKPEKIMIFAPNRMFLDYISEVLPELGVGEVQQTTFQEWAFQILQDRIEMGTRRKDAKWKGTLAYMRLLEQAYKDWLQSYLPKKPIYLWQEKEISVETLHTWFTKEYRYEPIAKRVERISARLEREVEIEHRDVRELDPRGNWKKQALRRIRKAVNSWKPPEITELYRTLKRTILPTEEEDWEWNDLAPLIFLHQQVYGISRQHQYQHIVIDEAQDYSPFQLEVLKRHVQGNSLTILGDLLQTIYQDRGIEDWKEFLSLFPESKATLFQLKRSYRSTQEIIKFANQIIAPFVEKELLAEAVSRNGEPITIWQGTLVEQKKNIVKKISELQQKGFKTIAVITPNEKSTNKWTTWLQNQGIPCQQISTQQDKYIGGISILEISLSKGMEFDAVLMVDVNSRHYPRDEYHAKLLFVGCTRALHELHMFASEEISPLLHPGE